MGEEEKTVDRNWGGGGEEGGAPALPLWIRHCLWIMD